MSNINGKAYAMNVITLMRPWKTILLRTLFFLLGRFKHLQADLIDLSFIQFARWVIVPRHRFPHLGPTQKSESLQYDYLLFFSNFNGTWNQYIDALSAVLSNGHNLIWRWSEKFPGSVHVTPFKEYIARVQFDTDCYYTAYPQATANDVKAAHVVQDAFHTLRAKVDRLSPADFQQAYSTFVLAVQTSLARPANRPPASSSHQPCTRRIMANQNGRIFELPRLFAAAHHHWTVVGQGQTRPVRSTSALRALGWRRLICRSPPSLAFRSSSSRA